MKNLVLFALTSILFFGSCDKDDLPGDLPSCVKSKVEDFQSDQKNCDNASVIEYEFQGQTVYVLSQGNCISDGGATVINSACEDVCFLGGIAGITDCNGEEFHTVATQTQVIWQN
ncbi:hypothetical protein OAF63_05775 [Saprospiraceae bacterium]|nr:hypothetical protein [Saprospiraceae bacterium]